MNRSSTRLRPLLGAALALGVAAGAAAAASATGGTAAPASATVVSQTAPAAPSSADCAAMGALTSDLAGTATSSRTPASVSAVRGRAAAAARATGSDDVRESAQNLADDLAALRVALSSAAGDPAEAAHRRADIEVMIRGDVAAMRRLCGR